MHASMPVFLIALAVGMIANPTTAVAQDTILITLGNLVQVEDGGSSGDVPVLDEFGNEIPIYQGDRTNSPGQVIGSFTGSVWNEINSQNDLWNQTLRQGTTFFPDAAGGLSSLGGLSLNYADGSSVPGGMLWTGRGGDVGADLGELRWKCCTPHGLNLASTGLYGNFALDEEVGSPTFGTYTPSGLIPEGQMAGILDGPGGTAGVSFRPTTGLRIELPAGEYEVYASGSPHTSRFGQMFGGQTGFDQRLYIGTVDSTDSEDIDLDVDLGAGSEFPLTQENYATWEAGDNFATRTLTIGVGEQLLIGVDMTGAADNTPDLNDFKLTAVLATVEIRRVSTGPDGDFDTDGDVDGADFLLWQRDMNVGNLSDWKTNFGTTPTVAAVVGVPEPSSATMMLLTAISGAAFRRRRCTDA